MSPTRSTPVSRFLRVLLCAAGATAMGAGCSGDGGKEGDGPEGCQSTRQFFAEEAWGPVFAEICMDCHAPGGLASEDSAALELVPPAYPGFLDYNLAHIQEVVKIEFDDRPIILHKPLGELEHGGGKQLDKGSKEYKLLAELIDRLQNGSEECAPGTGVASFDDVVLLDGLETYRKATLHLAGRLPHKDEIDRLLNEGEAALPSLLDGLLAEPAFYERLKEIWNDVLLTNRYLRYNGYSLNTLDDGQYPLSGDYYDTLDEDTQYEMGKAVAQEPLELIAFIVKNERPFSEILTADYTAMNPYSAQIFNSTTQYDNPQNAGDFKEARARVQVDGEWIDYPHAGLLTSPMWLNRFPTTPTNRNRHRARMILKHFLATDILLVAQRPVDPTAATAYANPTREDHSCAVCHRTLDPIAGAFQKFDENDQEQLEPDQEWHQEMFAPGYGDEQMTTADFGAAPQWLAQRIVADPRFATAVVYTMFKGITGQDPLTYPEDTTADDFKHRLAGWDAQDQALRAIAQKFNESGMNLKVAIKEIVLSPYFRAKNAVGELSEGRAAQLASVGTGRFLTPELLSRKIAAVLGYGWTRSANDYRTWLETDFRILYGGIDSDTVTDRLTQPNGIMSNVGWRMANEVACKSTAYDFTLDPSARKLFPEVTLEHMPESDTGDAVPGSVEAIRKNIRYLHAHVLGEALSLDDPEIDRTYQLFYDTWKEGKALVEAGSVEGRLTYSCRGRVDPYTGDALPSEVEIRDDDSYVVRSWMAVMTYLFADYRFLYE